MNAKHVLRFVSSLVILGTATANAADKEAADKDLKTLVKGAKDYQVVYSVNLLKKDLMKGGTATNYDTDNSAKLTGKIAKVGYVLILNGKDYAFVSMDPFTDDVKKIGVPDKASGARFQTKIKNLTVESNVKGVENGTFPEGGNIELWDCNYAPPNAAKVSGASDKKFDFGDAMATKASPGYGSMQVHNYAKKQTVLAFNNFRSGSRDIGIGNRPKSHPDWTFSKNSSKYKSAKLYVLVKTK